MKREPYQGIKITITKKGWEALEYVKIAREIVKIFPLLSLLDEVGYKKCKEKI